MIWSNMKSYQSAVMWLDLLKVRCGRGKIIYQNLMCVFLSICTDQLIVENLLNHSAYQVQIRHQSTQAEHPLWSKWSEVVTVPAGDIMLTWWKHGSYVLGFIGNIEWGWMTSSFCFEIISASWDCWRRKVLVYTWITKWHFIRKGHQISTESYLKL